MTTKSVSASSAKQAPPDGPRRRSLIDRSRFLALFFTAVFAQPFLSAASAQNGEQAPFAEDIRAFEEADAIAMPPKGGVLFVGSSSIRLWTTLPQDFPGKAVINRGFGGSQIADCIRYADRIVLPYAPRTIVFYAGDNDLAEERTPEQVVSDFRKFAETVHARLPNTTILFVSIKPSLARWALIDRIREANRLVDAYTRTSDRLGFVDVFPAMLGPDGRPRPELLGEDGLHMTNLGYAIWRDALAPLLQ